VRAQQESRPLLVPPVPRTIDRVEPLYHQGFTIYSSRGKDDGWGAIVAVESFLLSQGILYFAILAVDASLHVAINMR